MQRMAEQLERISEPADTTTAHILADLHEHREALAELLEITRRILRMLEPLERLAPVAERFALMADNPAAAFVMSKRKDKPDDDTGRGRRARRGRRE
jgi:hypothetical protein